MKNKLLFLIPLLLIAFPAFSHTINYRLENVPTTQVFGYYLQLGFTHILPNGFDHILFVLSLFLLNPNLKTVFLQATCFTIAHTITLILSANGTIVAPPAIIEPIIAVSILFMAIENMMQSELKKWRYLIVFAFGLVHGMGFASALNDVGLPRDAFYSSLISFNVGVELGQASILILAWFLVGKEFSGKPWYRSRITIPASLVIALIAGFWTIERIFFS
ncbi:hypothetical protein BH11BAC2_BH11BAC2_03170 [soil metagenome]